MSLQAYTPYTYSPGFKSGEFHHAVLSISGTTHTLYLDGSAVNINPDQPNIFNVYNTITNTVIGAQANVLTQAFKGIIGDVRVYNYAISASQVSSLYLNRNLVIHYPFDSSVNKMIPNYGMMTYDATMIGNLSLTTGITTGTNAFSFTNSSTTATQYVKSSPSNWLLNSTTGLTISCWVNTTGVNGRIMRIFDIPLDAGIKGLAVDISGSNIIYSGYYTAKGTIGGTGGGKLLFSSGYEYYVFTNTEASSTLTFSSNVTIDYLLVAAGGNGGSGHGGGGGAGGVLSSTVSNVNNINIAVGKPANATFGNNTPGGNTTITFNSTTITALGGSIGSSEQSLGTTGGSGGGAASYGNAATSGTPGQGYNGGSKSSSVAGGGGGGGGGAGGAGGTGEYTTNIGGAGGSGGAGTSLYSDWIKAISTYMNTIYTNWSTYTISGGIGYIASGGAGGAGSDSNNYSGYKTRTIGGGGDGGTSGTGGITRKHPTPGIPNTGGGGGGLGGNYAGDTAYKTVIQGGSGIVIIRVNI